MSEQRRRDRTRPLELIGLSVAIAVPVLLVVALVTRNWLLAAEFGAGAFIVALVVVAMALVAAAPKLDDDDKDERPHH